MGTKWQMPIAVIGKPTGDGRQFRAGALTHREMPLPLRYVRSDNGGHKEAVVVGRIDEIGDEADGRLPAKGEFYDGADWPEDIRSLATEARMLINEGVIGPSVDLDEAETEQIDAPEEFKLKSAKKDHAEKTDSDCGCGDFAGETKHINEVVRGRIASATVVHIPAFAELAGHAILTLDNQEEGGSGSQGAQFRQFDPGVGGGVDRDKLKASDFGDPAGRKFPIVTAGDVSDAASLIGKADDPAAVKARIIAIAKRKGFESAIPESWKSMTAAAAPLAPPAAWFAKPDLDGPTPLTISDTGRVFGHVAAWGTCHVGMGSNCITPPKSHTGYAYFHTGEVLTADGERIPVGRLTFGGGHATADKGYRAAADHYDNSCNTAAVVRAGEDEYGIWVAGSLVPDLPEETVYTLRHTPLSGDWRRIGGNLEMVGALHVNTAGFPIPRARLMVASGVEQCLTAAGALRPREVDLEALPTDPIEAGKQMARAFVAEQDAITERRRTFEGLVASVETQLWQDRAQEFQRMRAIAARDALLESVVGGE